MSKHFSHLQKLDSIRTILFLTKNDTNLVSINMMEFCTVIITNCVALTMLDLNPEVVCGVTTPGVGKKNTYTLTVLYPLF